MVSPELHTFRVLISRCSHIGKNWIEFVYGWNFFSTVFSRTICRVGVFPCAFLLAIFPCSLSQSFPVRSTTGDFSIHCFAGIFFRTLFRRGCSVCASVWTSLKHSFAGNFFLRYFVGLLDVLFRKSFLRPGFRGGFFSAFFCKGLSRGLFCGGTFPCATLPGLFRCVSSRGFSVFSAAKVFFPHFFAAAFSHVLFRRFFFCAFSCSTINVCSVLLEIITSRLLWGCRTSEMEGDHGGEMSFKGM